MRKHILIFVSLHCESTLNNILTIFPQVVTDKFHPFPPHATTPPELLAPLVPLARQAATDKEARRASPDPPAQLDNVVNLELPVHLETKVNVVILDRRDRLEHLDLQDLKVRNNGVNEFFYFCHFKIQLGIRHT